MKIPTQPINEASILISGDPSVGIPHGHVTVSDIFLDLSVLEEEDRATCLEEFRSKLREAFEGAFDTSVTVLFDFEYKEDDDES